MCSGNQKECQTKGVWSAFIHELIHHFPYATVSVALAMMILSMINVFFDTGIAECTSHVHDHVCGHGAHTHTSGMDVLFHSFHFVHILFATSGAMLTFYRYSSKIWYGIVLGLVSSMVFCTLSDVLLPYVAGKMLGIDMDLHICFYSELANIVPFLLVGVLSGLCMAHLPELKNEHSSVWMHFMHTLISAMASTFYAVGHGLQNFQEVFGMFFLVMVVAVIVPCTLADVAAPILVARMVEKE